MGQHPEDTGETSVTNENAANTKPNFYTVVKTQVLFCSDRDGYGGGREPRGYMERPSTGSYRDPYDGYGKTKTFSVVKMG